MIDYFCISLKEIYIMALIKFGIVVVDARGKLGGHVFTKTRSGATLRTKVTPTNPRSTAQQSARALLGLLSAQWRTLTEAQREAWNAAVPNWSKTNIFGDSYNNSGKNLFVRLNTNLSVVFATVVLSPPLPGEVLTPFMQPNTLSATSVILDIANSDAGQRLEFWATAPLSAGISNFDGKYRIVTAGITHSSGSQDLTAAYDAKFGAPIVGQKVSFKIVAVNITTGQVTVPVIITNIVA